MTQEHLRSFVTQQEFCNTAGVPNIFNLCLAYMTRPGHPKAREVLKGDFLQNQETGAEKYHDPLREKGRFGCFLGHGGAPFTSLNY